MLVKLDDVIQFLWTYDEVGWIEVPLDRLETALRERFKEGE